MKAILLEIKGNWAQFRKAETNNNPLSHDFITKTAFIGMVGAVLGIERKDMKELFPKFSNAFLYGVQIVNAVNKQSWGFTLRSVSHSWDKAPKQMEFLKNAHYRIILVLKDSSCIEYFEKFSDFIKKGKACYQPVLGLHNCPAEIKFISEGEISEKSGDFETYGFVTNDYTPNMESMTDFRIGFDKIPTYQNNDFWNIPEKFVSVIYPSENNKISVSGKYYNYKNESQWCLI